MALLCIKNVIKITNKVTKQIVYKPEIYYDNYRTHLYNTLNTTEEVDKAYNTFIAENTFDTIQALYDELTGAYYELNSLTYD